MQCVFWGLGTQEVRGDKSFNQMVLSKTKEEGTKWENNVSHSLPFPFSRPAFYSKRKLIKERLKLWDRDLHAFLGIIKWWAQSQEGENYENGSPLLFVMMTFNFY